jgi:hypothetical protein
MQTRRLLASMVLMAGIVGICAGGCSTSTMTLTQREWPHRHWLGYTRSHGIPGLRSYVRLYFAVEYRGGRILYVYSGAGEIDQWYMGCASVVLQSVQPQENRRFVGAVAVDEQRVTRAPPQNGSAGTAVQEGVRFTVYYIAMSTFPTLGVHQNGNYVTNLPPALVCGVQPVHDSFILWASGEVEEVPTPEQATPSGETPGTTDAAND